MTVSFHKGLEVHAFADAPAFREWLNDNAEQTEAIWLRFAKKASGETSLTYIEARDEALCFGWIDSVINGLDDKFYLTKFSQRRPKSVWSKINCGVVEGLIASGRMTPRGQAEIEKAKADGRWDRAYEPQSTATVPEDLADAINANPKAADFFKKLTGASRYALIYRTNSAKTEATRSKRIREFVEMLEREEAPHLIKPS